MYTKKTFPTKSTTCTELLDVVKTSLIYLVASNGTIQNIASKREAITVKNIKTYSAGHIKHLHLWMKKMEQKEWFSLKDNHFVTLNVVPPHGDIYRKYRQDFKVQVARNKI